MEAKLIKNEMLFVLSLRSVPPSYFRDKSTGRNCQLARGKCQLPVPNYTKRI